MHVIMVGLLAVLWVQFSVKWFVQFNRPTKVYLLLLRVFVWTTGLCALVESYHEYSLAIFIGLPLGLVMSLVRLSVWSGPDDEVQPDVS